MFDIGIAEIVERQRLLGRQRHRLLQRERARAASRPPDPARRPAAGTSPNPPPRRRDRSPRPYALRGLGRAIRIDQRVAIALRILSTCARRVGERLRRRQRASIVAGIVEHRHARALRHRTANGPLADRPYRASASASAVAPSPSSVCASSSLARSSSGVEPQGAARQHDRQRRRDRSCVRSAASRVNSRDTPNAKLGFTPSPSECRAIAPAPDRRPPSSVCGRSRLPLAASSCAAASMRKS